MLLSTSMSNKLDDFSAIEAIEFFEDYWPMDQADNLSDPLSKARMDMYAALVSRIDDITNISQADI